MNLHIFLSTIESETRLFKETQFTLKEEIFTKIGVCGLWSDGLPKLESLDWGLELYRKKTLLNYFKNMNLFSGIKVLRRIIAMLSLVQYGVFVIKTTYKLKPTHISCHNVVLLPLVWLSSRIVRAELIYVPHELETERTHLNGLQKKLEKIIEKKFIYSCSQIIVVCEPILKWYKEKYKLSNIYVVRNVPKKSNIKRNNTHSNILRKTFDIPHDSQIVIYQGIFGSARGTSDLLDIFSSFKDDNIHLVLMGMGEATITEEIKRFEKEFMNIHYQPAVNMQDIISYTSSADIGIFITNMDSLSYRFSLPNKFFEYMHSGIPIIVSENLEYLSELVKLNNLGWVTSLDKIKNTILIAKSSNKRLYEQRILDFAKDAVWEKDAEIYKYVYKQTKHKT